MNVDYSSVSGFSRETGLTGHTEIYYEELTHVTGVREVPDLPWACWRPGSWWYGFCLRRLLKAAEGCAPAQQQSGRGMSPFLALCSTQAQMDEAVSLTQSVDLNVYLVQKTPRIIVNQVSRHPSGDDT